MPLDIKYSGAPTQTPEEARRSAATPEVRVDYPHVQLTRAGAEAGAEIGRATGVLGATMHTLGASIDTLGKTFDGVGNELFNRAVGLKQLESETKVNNAAIAWEQGQIKSDEAFRSTAGENASSAALEAKFKSDEDARQKVRSGLSSPYEQKLFDQQTTRPFITSARQASEHSAQETKTLAKQTSDAKLGLLTNRFAGAKEDADAEATAKEAEAWIRGDRHHLLGQTQDQVDRDVLEWRSKAIAGRAERMALDDPTHAKKILDDNKEELDKFDVNIWTRATERVNRYRDTRDVRNATDRADIDKKASLEDKQKLLDEEIKRIGRDGPNDVEFQERASKELVAKHNRDLQEDRDNHRKAYELIDKTVHGRMPGQDGNIQDNMDKVTAYDQDKIKGALDQLTGEEHKHFERLMQENAYDRYPASKEADAIFHYWIGASIEDPGRFLDKENETPGFLEELPIPKNQRAALWNRLYELKAKGDKADQDIASKRIYDYGANSGLIPANINANDKTSLHSYIDTELQVWHSEHPGKMPTADDKREIINSAMRNITVPGRFFGTNTTPAYKQAARPSGPYAQKFEQFKDQFQKAHPDAGPEEIQKGWTYEFYKDLLKQQQGKKDQNGPPITPKAVTTVPVAPGGGPAQAPAPVPAPTPAPAQKSTKWPIFGH